MMMSLFMLTHFIKVYCNLFKSTIGLNLHRFTIMFHKTLSICAFLCRWMEACLEESLPPTTELEEGLRNGVYLGKLANFFNPKLVSAKKIYDRDQARYKVHLSPSLNLSDQATDFLTAPESFCTS